MNKIFLPVLVLILIGCTNKTESIKLVCNGNNYISSRDAGKFEPGIPVNDLKFHFVIENGLLSEVNYNRHKNIPCQKFSSNEISCNLVNKKDKTETKISFDRLNGTVKTRKESIMESEYVLIDEFDGRCQTLNPKF